MRDLNRSLKCVRRSDLDEPRVPDIVELGYAKRRGSDDAALGHSLAEGDTIPIRALRDLNVKGRREKPKCVQVMAARRHKTLVVCRTCHVDIHHGRSNPHNAEVGSVAP